MPDVRTSAQVCLVLAWVDLLAACVGLGATQASAVVAPDATYRVGLTRACESSAWPYTSYSGDDLPNHEHCEVPQHHLLEAALGLCTVALVIAAVGALWQTWHWLQAEGSFEYHRLWAWACFVQAALFLCTFSLVAAWRNDGSYGCGSASGGVADATAADCWRDPDSNLGGLGGHGHLGAGFAFLVLGFISSVVHHMYSWAAHDDGFGYSNLEVSCINYCDRLHSFVTHALARTASVARGASPATLHICNAILLFYGVCLVLLDLHVRTSHWTTFFHASVLSQAFVAGWCSIVLAIIGFSALCALQKRFFFGFTLLLFLCCVQQTVYAANVFCFNAGMNQARAVAFDEREYAGSAYCGYSASVMSFLRAQFVALFEQLRCIPRSALHTGTADPLYDCTGVGAGWFQTFINDDCITHNATSVASPSFCETHHSSPLCAYATCLASKDGQRTASDGHLAAVGNGVYCTCRISLRTQVEGITSPIGNVSIGFAAYEFVLLVLCASVLLQELAEGRPWKQVIGAEDDPDMIEMRKEAKWGAVGLASQVHELFWGDGDGSGGGGEGGTTQADDLECLDDDEQLESSTTAPYVGMNDNDESYASGSNSGAGEFNGQGELATQQVHPGDAAHDNDSTRMSEVLGPQTVVIEPTGGNGTSSFSDLSSTVPAVSTADAAMSAK